MKVSKKSKQSMRGIVKIGQPKERSILDIMPYKSCTKEGILRTHRDTFQRYYRIASTDIEGLNEQEQLERMNQLTTVMRTFIPSIKQTHMTTRTDLSLQIQYKREKLKQNRLMQTKAKGKELGKLRKYESKLVEEIKELQLAEQELPDLSFFYSIEGKTMNELNMRNSQIMRASGILGLQPIYKEPLIPILRRLNNMTEE